MIAQHKVMSSSCEAFLVI